METIYFNGEDISPIKMIRETVIEIEHRLDELFGDKMKDETLKQLFNHLYDDLLEPF